MICKVWAYSWGKVRRMWKRYPKKGVFWHVHHDILCEWCYSYEERVGCIIFWKPSGETKRRLMLFQPVKGKLPEGFTGSSDKGCWRLKESIREHTEALEALHKKEHPNCPWDGETIFS